MTGAERGRLLDRLCEGAEDGLRAALADPRLLRKRFVLAEILGPPLALRPGGDGEGAPGR